VIAYHRVPVDRFAALASGLGGPAAVTELAAAQSSKRRLLLRYLLDAQSGQDARTATEVLITADRRDRRAVADLMGDPLVGAWMARTVRRLLDADTSVPPRDDLAQLGALAAAAALRTGQVVTISTRARAGRVTLPTVGTALIGSDGPVVVTVARDAATVSSSTVSVRIADDDPRWLPLRRLSARYGDLVATLAVEDCNPYRDSYHAPPADRLSPDDIRRWQNLFSDAWSMLARRLPIRGAELASGLRSVVPLATSDSEIARSGTSRDSLGAMGLTCPRSASEFVITLIHEFQHSKLSGMLDLVPMTVPDGRELHFAPWRVDPRPTAGLLQGAYAFLGVADAWRALRAEPLLEDRATREFAVVRRQVDVGLTALEESTELTGRGREFVTGLRAAVDLLLKELVPAPIAAEAETDLAECRRAWQERNPMS
jgi:HEXXH motif-containing protein